MNYFISSLLVILMTSTIGAQDWTGTWEGMLNAGTQELKIIFHLEKNAAGDWQATMDSPDQMAYDLKMDDVTIKNNEITMSLTAAHAQYVGTLNEDKTSIKGNWVQGVPLPLELTRAEKKSHKRPQEPQAPFPYTIEEVTYENKKEKFDLAGTLTLPEGEGKHPVVILISGSGPQDRDETILKHKPFWVLADYLTRNGFAVLRFDDRGVGASGGDFSKATSADFATDVMAGVDFLKKHPNIDPKRIGLMGHSEGGLIAPIVASKDKKIAFIVLLAGPGVPGNELLLKQSYDIMVQKGTDEKLLKTANKIGGKLYEAIINDKNNKLGTNELLELVKPDLSSLSEEDKKEIGGDEVTLRQSIAALRSPWMFYFINSNPADYLKKVKCPVLAINGDKDIQVAGEQNLDGIRAALAKNKKVKTALLPNLNHLFQTSETGAVEEYVKIEETFSPEAMKLILDWMKSL
ncbi:alpha/beta hydrolase family protein [Aureispira anguillae]|uniref:Alpha/beta fold hydrolase n=1 Tax=Aureispira anguillae TaxID=2864201 RepID=A0A915YI59_9BACT|nr:alpha/beta fold hydrolase [Aureispira anguillae]BDS13637.1 alpha/beta fold hydrolase [Aureispira anguillae]